MNRWTRTIMSTLLVALVATSAPGAEDAATRLPSVPRIIAIGDLHGDLDATLRALRLAGAINDENEWVGGDLVVVQTGDQLDRGEDEQAILDLLERLVKEAAAAGGALHVLNGNHEIMNAELDLRYVTEGGFEDFADAASRDVVDSTLASHPPEQRGRVAAFRPGGSYARVLAGRNLAIIVGDNVFVHGGVLPEHVDFGLEKMNEESRAWLRGESPAPEWLNERNNVYWTREYSDEPDAASCEVLAEVLERLGASRMVVGHTVQEGGITSYCEGMVWCIDVGMSRHYGGDVEVLEIVGDSVRAIPEAVGAASSR